MVNYQLSSEYILPITYKGNEWVIVTDKDDVVSFLAPQIYLYWFSEIHSRSCAI